jgi:hypothetical protein
MPDYLDKKYWQDAVGELIGDEKKVQMEDYRLSGLKPEDIVDPVQRAEYERYLKTVRN